MDVPDGSPKSLFGSGLKKIFGKKTKSRPPVASTLHLPKTLKEPEASKDPTSPMPASSTSLLSRVKQRSNVFKHKKKQEDSPVLSSKGSYSETGEAALETNADPQISSLTQQECNTGSVCSNEVGDPESLQSRMLGILQRAAQLEAMDFATRAPSVRMADNMQPGNSHDLKPLRKQFNTESKDTGSSSVDSDLFPGSNSKFGEDRDDPVSVLSLTTTRLKSVRLAASGKSWRACSDHDIQSARDAHKQAAIPLDNAEDSNSPWASSCPALAPERSSIIKDSVVSSSELRLPTTSLAPSIRSSTSTEFLSTDAFQPRDLTYEPSNQSCAVEGDSSAPSDAGAKENYANEIETQGARCPSVASDDPYVEISTSESKSDTEVDNERGSANGLRKRFGESSEDEDGDGDKDAWPTRRISLARDPFIEFSTRTANTSFLEKIWRSSSQRQ